MSRIRDNRIRRSQTPGQHALKRAVLFIVQNPKKRKGRKSEPLGILKALQRAVRRVK